MTQLHWLATGVEVASEHGVYVCVIAGEGALKQSLHPHDLAGSILVFTNLEVLETDCPLLSSPL